MDARNALREQALGLSPVDRAGLIEDLLASFDAAARDVIDRAWADEAEDRLDAYEDGMLGAIPISEARKRVGAE